MSPYPPPRAKAPQQQQQHKLAVDLELDGYSTGSSVDDISDDAYVSEDEGESAFDEDHPLLFINITDIFSGVNIPDVEIEDSEDPFKNTELVIKFSSRIKSRALKWFINKKILAKKSDGGAELLLSREPYYGDKHETIVFHVTASCWRQLEVAEMLEIKKLDYSRSPPVPREFNIREIHKFRRPDMENHEILTPAERQFVILHELTHLHSLPGETSIPGYSKDKEEKDKKIFQLKPGQSIFHLFKATNLITSYFALHNKEDLRKLEGKWLFPFWDPWPYEEIRNYFGERACLYFNFVAYYSLILLFPSFILGVITNFFMGTYHIYAMVVCSFCNMISVTIFLIMWQRYQSNITFKWGTYKMSVWEEPRAGYYGTLGIDPVTGRIQYHYPYYHTYLKTYGGSAIVVLFLCSVAILGMCLYVEIERDIREKNTTVYTLKNDGLFEWALAMFFDMLPGILYASAVCGANFAYRRLAKFLTEWENHRTERQFEKHLVLKMVVFEIINNFCLFFYTAFYLRDMQLLQRRLLVFLSVVEVWMMWQDIFLFFGQTQLEKFLKAATRKIKSDKKRRESEYSGGLHERSSQLFGDIHDVNLLSEDDPRVAMSKVEELLFPYNYESDFDDYLFLFLQFGYISLFSFVYPMAAGLALSCNILLLYFNFYKRREVFQRPFATRVSNIGAWQGAFEFMAVFSICTNCALIAINPTLRESFPNWTDAQWLIMFIIFEHFCLGIHFGFKILIAKVPNKIRLTMAALKYQSWEALKREQARSTRRRMTKVFRPINDDLFLQNKAEEGIMDTRYRANLGQTNKKTQSVLGPSPVQPRNQGGSLPATAKKKTK